MSLEGEAVAMIGLDGSFQRLDDASAPPGLEPTHFVLRADIARTSGARS
jgi:hypothetical protein